MFEIRIASPPLGTGPNERDIPRFSLPRKKPVGKTVPCMVSGVNPCLNNTACWEGAHCVVDRLGAAECRCPEPTVCETSVRPVCGSDGHTYESACHLERIGCNKRSGVRAAYDGHCGENDGRAAGVAETGPRPKTVESRPRARTECPTVFICIQFRAAGRKYAAPPHPAGR